MKPLLDEDRSNYDAAKLLIPVDEESVEELEEERELEESLKSYPSVVSEKEEQLSSNGPMDPLTGRRLYPLSADRLRELNEKLFQAAQQRPISGPVIPLLPILEKRQEILDVIQRNRVVVLSGDTGCGKSTQLPQYILDSFALDRKGAECNIITTQPRRLAALSLARTVANHRGEQV